MTRFSLLTVAALVVVTMLVAGDVGAATIVIQNEDGPGEGFNDPGAPTVAPGNPGVTLGAQRLFAFQYAADIWAAFLSSNVTILVQAQMDPQFCNATSATLGSASTFTVHRDWVTGTLPIQATWYPSALADAMAGVDLNPPNPDINATFNSNLNGNPACLGGGGWYYGTDQNPPAGDIDFISVVTHELGHGLGFQTFQNSAGGWFAPGPTFIPYPDTYGSNMYHVGNAPPDYLSMTDPQRAVCNIADPDTRWDGASVKANAANYLSGGVDGNGRVQLHCPNPYQGGSSLSHWSPATNPNRIMEPFYNGPNHDVILEVILLKDLGWSLAQQVATAVSNFDVRPRALAVDISAEFHSDAERFTVNVLRGEGSVRPNVVIHGVDLRGGDALSYTDRDVVPGNEYSYQISVRDTDGKFFSPTQTVRVPVARANLAQNIPNPFNPTTKISYELPATRDVTLVIYDTQGRVVVTLVSGVRGPGPHGVTWDGKDANGNRVSSGVYFYRLVSGDFSETKKMVLLK